MSNTKSLHYELCCKAATWIRQPKNREPWKTQYILSAVEIICVGAENPDVYATTGEVSAIIEVKTSHADFLADQKKYTRTHTEWAMGDFRYYLCPEGIIKPEELPQNWGLLYYRDGKIQKIVQAQIQPCCRLCDLFVVTSIMRREGLTGRTFNYRNMATTDDYQDKIDAGICPDCGAELVNESGCSHCPVCGFSVCGNN